MTHHVSYGTSGKGWLNIEIVLVRLNQAYAPNSSFSVHAAADVDYPSPVGYDVAVCVEDFKSYMVDSYNNVSHSRCGYACSGKLILMILIYYHF
jgi:hypothetical protein